MRALALGVTLIAAKAVGLAGQTIPASWWAAPAFIWQDVAVAAAFWAVDRTLGRPRWMWAVYAAIVAAAAVTVPITRVLGSPLTVPMLRAAGGPLADSIAHELTAANIAMIAVVLAIGALLPALAVSRAATDAPRGDRRRPRRARLPGRLARRASTHAAAIAMS